MNTLALREKKQKVIQRYGDWTDHNIHIAGDLYTIGEDVLSTRLRRIVQIVADVAKEPLANLRVLDLACLEGLYAIEFARQGAHPKSFWLTERSLYNLLSACGFTTVYQCQVPADVHKPADRVTLLAIKGKPQTLMSTPRVNETPVAGWPERWKPRVSPDQDPRVQISKRLSHMVPSALKRPVKAVLRATGLMAKGPQPWRAEPRPPRDATKS